MPIVETKIVSRPNTSVPFFNQTSNTVRLAVHEQLTTLENAGKYSMSSTVSANGLTQTNVATLDSIDTFSQYDTILSIALDAAYQNYAEENGLTHGPGRYNLSGITGAFSVTTTYTYNENTSYQAPLFDGFVSYLEASPLLVSFTNTGSVITAVHNYDNVAEYIESYWVDYPSATFLQAGGVTRTISYARL